MHKHDIQNLIQGASGEDVTCHARVTKFQPINIYKRKKNLRYTLLATELLHGFGLKRDSKKVYINMDLRKAFESVR